MSIFIVFIAIMTMRVKETVTIKELMLAFQIFLPFQRGTHPFHGKFRKTQFDMSHPVCSLMGWLFIRRDQL